MTTADSGDISRVLAGFDAALNAQGYPFQYAVLKQARDALEQRRSEFVFEATEFPVEVQGASTRIDIVLRQRHWPTYLICECKRANPALADWCFARAPLVTRLGAELPVIMDTLTLVSRPSGDVIRAGVAQQWHPSLSAQIGLEVKHHAKKGDTGGAPGRNAIEDAATQVLRGLNGFVDFACRRPTFFAQEPSVGGGGRDVAYRFFPVVFTTASLFLSEVDLSKTELSTGRVDVSGAGFRRVDWLCLQYHESPGLKHSAQRELDRKPDTLSRVLLEEFVRTVAFVAPEGITEFLVWASNLV